jgi:serine/threonine protein kinase
VPELWAADNDPDATFAGVRLEFVLRWLAVPPPNPASRHADRFAVRSGRSGLPDHNAYEAVAGSAETFRSSTAANTEIRRAFAGRAAGPPDPRPRVFSLEDAAAAFERFGLFKPVEHAIDGENRYFVFEQIKGQVTAHLDQTDEKEARALGLQLCALAEQFHRHGWVYNGFEPYGIVLDQEGRLRLIGFDRARQAGSRQRNPT